MAVPKRRRSSSASRQRRMHIFINPAVLTTCQKCNVKVRPHTVCKHCGFYKGKEVINVLGKLTKKERKIKEIKIKSTEKEHSHEEKGMNMEELSKK